jgi:arylsulfatase A-like enzyme
MSLAFALPLFLAPLGQRPDVQRNVLLIVVDDLGVDSLSLYGNYPGQPQTPRIDALAQKGVLFQQAYANPQCSPTRATIQTGRHGFRTGIGGLVYEDNMALPLSETTLPEMLDLGTGGGYSHAVFGKWHLGNDSVGGNSSPLAAGYGHFAGTLFGLFPPNDYFTWLRIENGSTSWSSKYTTTSEVDDAIQWITNAQQPWLVYLPVHAPHRPFHVPPDGLHHILFTEDIDPRAKIDRRPYLAAMIEALDTELGRLLDSIPKRVLDKTTVILVGDNGTAPDVAPPPLDPLKVKDTVYEGGIHVPLIVTGPDVVSPGRQVSALVHTTDLFATVADLANVDLGALSLPTLDSVSIRPYLKAASQVPLRETVFSERFAPNGSNPTTFQRAIRNARFKLIVRHIGPDELYDLSLDPLELAPLPLGQLDPLQQANYDLLTARLAALLQSP